MKYLLVTVTCGLFLFSSLSASAGERITYTPVNKSPGKIVEYVEKAARLILEKGEDDAFLELTDPGGPWVKDDWYLYVNNFDGYVVAHLNNKLVGKKMFGVRDVKGNAFFAQFQKAAQSESGRGWVEFWWPKPNSETPSRKLGFVIRVPGRRLWVGTGVYDMSTEDIEKILEREVP